MLPYFKIFADLINTVGEMSEDEAGRLLKALLEYVNGGKPVLSGAEKYVFLMLKTQIDRDSEQYEAMVQSARENGAKGGRPRKNQGVFEKTEGFLENQGVFEKTEKTQEEEKEKEEEKDNIYNTRTRAGGKRGTWNGYQPKPVKPMLTRTVTEAEFEDTYSEIMNRRTSAQTGVG